MDKFESKLLKLIFKAGTSNLVKLDLSKLKYDDRLLINDFIEYGALSLNKKKELIVNKDFISYTGEVVRIKEKFSFVHIEELDEDYYVKNDYLNDALIHDKVKIWIFPNTDKGVVECILEHANKEVVGTLSYSKRVHVKPNDISIPYIYLEENSIISSPNDLVVVSITNYENELRGVIKEVLGNKNTPGVDILAKVYEHNVPYEFSEETKEYVKNKIPKSLRVSSKMKSERLDLRDELIVTIDGKDAKDFDDAISVSINEDGTYRLGVHIADVTHYVKKKSALDLDAIERGTSVYLTDRVVPMLPFELSNGICSLNPDEDRLTLSCIMNIDENGNVLTYDIKKSIIHSKYRLTYEDVNKLYNHELKMDKELSEMLFLAKRLASKIRKERESRGSIDLDIDEAKLIIDTNGKVVDIVKRDRGISEMMIEDFMISANESVASYIYYMELPFIYRIHENPPIKKLKDLKQIINPLGYYLNINNEMHATVFQNILSKSKGRPEEDVIRQMILRSMAKAIYHRENKGHFGLGSKCYTHFTSPIRRYPDLLVHRLLKMYISEDITDLNYSKLEGEIDVLADKSSKAERRAVDLERDVTRMKMAEYMENMIGEVFVGNISGMIESGMFIELDNTIEGMIKFETIRSDFLIFDPKRMVVYSRGSKKEYRLGDPLKVICLAASKETGKIEFTLVNERKKESKPKERKHSKKRHK